MRFDCGVLTLAISFYGLNRAAKNQLYIPSSPLTSILYYHFNDYLGAIVFAVYVNLLLRAVGWKPIQRLRPLLFLALLCSVFWEGLAPLFLSYSTADWRDCIAYLFGFLTYWLLCRIKPEAPPAPPDGP